MKGEKRESFGGLKVGFAESKVIAINPDNEELRSLGYNIDENKDEIVYLKEKDGVDTIRLDFFMSEVKTGYKYKKTFFLENTIVQTKQKEGIDNPNFVPKFQFVNATGDSFYCEDESNLPDRFTNFIVTEKVTKNKKVLGEKSFRKAKVGEAALLAFIRKWLDLQYMKPSTDILLDLKAIFRGDVSELTEQINGGNDQTVVDVLEVNRVEKEGEETKEYQAVYKTSLRGSEMRILRGTTFTEDLIEKWRSEKYNKNSNPDGRYLKDYEELALEITDSQYGSKNYFLLEPFQEYDVNKNPASMAETIDTASSKY